jgi:folate-binding protein YgfZ
MTEPRFVTFDRRGVVGVGGADARKFLNDLVTADIGRCADGSAVYGGLLSPQGKILFDFIIFADGEGYVFDLPRAVIADFVKRLTLYRLRAKVAIADLSDERRVIASWGGGRPAIEGPIAADPRLAELGYRGVVARGTRAPPGQIAAGEAEYDVHRIGLGVPEGGIDYAFGDAFPHDADMDQLGGVDFDKGCYVGQEVVSRMQHRGTARRRIVVATGGDLTPGAEVKAGERPLGSLASVAGGVGLALVRIDRVKEAVDAGETVLAGRAPIKLSLPAWARFGWPAAGMTTENV